MNLGDKIFSGAIWSFAERVSTQLIQVILGIVLARLLTPNDYGLIGLLLVFISLSQVFIDSGFSAALIQKKNRSENDISTVFIFNILISIIFYILLWFCAPYVADFYENQQLDILLKVMALSLLVNALFSVPLTLVTIDLNFKLLAKINFIAVLVSGGIAIALAYNEFGVWALVYQTLIKALATLILLWFLTKWKPSSNFSVNSFKEMFSYGSKILIGSLLNTGANNISSLLIGKIISAKELGYYTQGVQYTDLILRTLNAMYNKVLLPTLSKIQDQKEALVKYTKSVLKISGVFITPIFFILIVIAEPFIKVLLGEDWLPVVPIIQIFSVSRFITLICGINVNLLYVLGRTDLALKQQYSKIPIRLILILISIKFGIIYVALAELTSTIIHYFIDSFYPGKIMQYGALKQIKDLSKILMFNILLLITSFIFMYFLDNEILKLILTPIFYILLYILGNYFFKNPEFMIPFNKINKMFLNRKK